MVFGWVSKWFLGGFKNIFQGIWGCFLGVLEKLAVGESCWAMFVKGLVGLGLMLKLR